VLLGLFLAIAALLTAGHSARPEDRARPVNPFDFGDPAFCETRKPVEDFGISALPPVKEPPASGNLPFAPKTVTLELAGGPVLPLGESSGFWLHSDNFSGHTPLHWVLRDRIRTVDPSGVPGQVVAHSRTRVRLINAGREVKLFLQPPRQIGFYLYEIDIFEFGGKQLAHYSRYLKAEEPFWRAQFGLNGARFHAGQRVLSRVENLGTEPIEYGEEFGIQREVGAQWVHVRNPNRDGWLLWAGFAGPGLAGRCSSLFLPRRFPAGQYRLVKPVEPPSEGPPNGKLTEYLTAPFQVVG
jgi:hypothetical protein